jgi:putative oxidoreductase
MKNIIYKLTNPIKMPFWWQDVLFLIPRIFCGYCMTVEFGAPKFGLPWSPEKNGLGLFEVAFWFPNDVAEYGGIFALAPAFFAWMAAFAEGIGGIALILGFQTRVFSFLILCTMFVAAVIHQFSYGLWNMLPALGFMWVALFYMILGSGRFGLDYIFTKKRNHE